MPPKCSVCNKWFVTGDVKVEENGVFFHEACRSGLGAAPKANAKPAAAPAKVAAPAAAKTAAPAAAKAPAPAAAKPAEEKKETKPAEAKPAAKPAAETKPVEAKTVEAKAEAKSPAPAPVAAPAPAPVAAGNELEQLKELLAKLTVAQPNAELAAHIQDIIDKAKYGAGGGGDLPRSIRGYDEYLTTKLDPFVAAGAKLGGDANDASLLVKACWDEMRNFLLAAAAVKEPSQADQAALFKPIAEKVHAISQATKRNEWENHLKTCSEGVGALSWLMVKPAPRDFIENFVGGSDFWANKIRKEHRTTAPDHVVFVDTFKALLLGLMDYVKEFHTTGVAWNNAKGVTLAEYKSGSGGGGSSAAVPAAAAPAPATAHGSSAVPVAPTANLFAELKPDGATAGLKKVTKEQQTWRAEFKGGDAPAPAPVAKKAPVAAAPQVKGPAKCEFQQAGQKWVVENQTSFCEIQISSIKETVYIFGCAGATIDVKGKCKSIVVDTCKKTNVVFDIAYASCEIVNSQRMNITCRDTVASVAIDKTDGIVVTLPNTSLDSKIVASKSSEMNVSWPDATGELIERPIPEQYVHQINAARNGVTAEVSDLYN